MTCGGSLARAVSCVAVCCSVLQRVAACGSVLQFQSMRYPPWRPRAWCKYAGVRVEFFISNTWRESRALCCMYVVVQCVSLGCSVYAWVAVCIVVLQCVAVYCSVLQCVAVCCSVMQCVAVCCSVLQCECVSLGCSVYAWVAVCIVVLLCVAVYCCVLQHVALRQDSCTCIWCAPHSLCVEM